jgi:hypothetical protein
MKKGIKPKTEFIWNQMETSIWGNVSNRKPKSNGIKPTEWNQTETKIWGKVSNRKPKKNGTSPKPSIERKQFEKHDVLESKTKPVHERYR